MAQSNEKQQLGLTKDKQSLSADDAALASFFSLLAIWAIRLTAVGKKNNTTNSTSTREDKP
jgi:hypothetical protein